MFRRWLTGRLNGLRPVGAVLVLALGAIHSAEAGSYRDIYVFKGLPDGDTPYAGVVRDTQGRLYGTTNLGGQYDMGTVFRLTPPVSSNGKWTEEILHNFGSQLGDGRNPVAAVTLGADGSVYGTFRVGTPVGYGGVFKLANAPGWPETILHSFSGTGPDGGGPETPLVFGSDGLLYGVTGDFPGQKTLGHLGVLFSVSPLGDQVEFAVLQEFGQGRSGRAPFGLTATPPALFNGFVGSTAYSASATVGAGTAYLWELGQSSPLTMLYNFQSNGTDVIYPESPPILGFGAVNKKLFGFTGYGGAFGKGGVYQLASAGADRVANAVLYSFGAQPNDPRPTLAGTVLSSLVQVDDTGKMIATAGGGGVYNGGAFFELDPPASPGGPWAEKVDVSFNPSQIDGGSNPVGTPLKMGGVYYGALFSTPQNKSHVRRGAIYQLTP